MPTADYTDVRDEDFNILTTGNVGYDWIPNRFGPPPGISRTEMSKIGKF